MTKLENGRNKISGENFEISVADYPEKRIDFLPFLVAFALNELHQFEQSTPLWRSGNERNKKHPMEIETERDLKRA